MSHGIIQEQVILVKTTEEEEGSFPDGSGGSQGRVYKCLICKVSQFAEEEGGGGLSITVGSPDKAIYCANFRNNRIVKDAYYMAYRLGNRWVLDNQATFLDFQ